MMCSKVAQRATNNLGYFINKLYDQQLLKNAQYGHIDYILFFENPSSSMILLSVPILWRLNEKICAKHTWKQLD